MARTRVRKKDDTSPLANELDDTLSAVRKRYGPKTVHKAHEIHQPDRISTGVFILDFATLGGIPHNRASMFLGNRHSGKSMMANYVIASAQRQYPDQVPVLLDVEGTFDATWAEALGVDLNHLEVIECDTGEMAADVGVAVTQSRETSLVVVDSIAALAPMKEQNESVEDANVALQAKLVAKFVRKTTAAMIKERQRNHLVTLLHLNQYRTKIGGYSPQGEARTVPGGRALEYSTTLQVDIRNKENKGKDSDSIDTVTHNDHSYTISKNKMNNGPRTGEFTVMRVHDEKRHLTIGDVDDAHALIAYSKKFGLYTGGGKSQKLEFGEHNLKFGKQEEATQALREDYDLYWELRTHLIRMQAAKLGMPKEFIGRIV